MHFTQSTLLAIMATLATAQTTDVKVHVVKVSSGTAPALTFTPNNLKAAVGDMIQFQFGIGNHTVTQSSFDAPCLPLGYDANAQDPAGNLTGIHSGHMPVKAGDDSVPTFTVPVKDEKPMWLYCATGKHCQGGMVMVVNDNTAKNASRSLSAYTAAAAQAPENISPSNLDTGSSTNPDTPSPSESSGSDYGSGSPYGAGDSTGDDAGNGSGDDSATGGEEGSTTEEDPAESQTDDALPVSTGAASALKASWFVGLVGVGAALLL